jgi:hypothetical protein
MSVQQGSGKLKISRSASDAKPTLILKKKKKKREERRGNEGKEKKERERI